MPQKQTRTRSWVFLLLLAGLILTACSGVNTLLPSAKPLTAPSSTTVQTANSGEWNAATFFATTCASCHGPTGQGTAVAPALNREAIQTASTDWLVETISNGRSGTAMPAWSVEFDGPLTSEQIADMAAFLQAGNWDKAGEIAAEQPVQPMGPGMMGGHMGSGMMGSRMMGGGNDRMP